MKKVRQCFVFVITKELNAEEALFNLKNLPLWHSK